MFGRVGDDDTAPVAAANDAFYAAFEAGDTDAMAAVWDHSDAVACTHPGWATRHGWDDVAESWAAILGSAERLQFILTDVRITRRGDVAWVTADENLVGPDGPGGTVAALNVFHLSDGGWRMVVHHGSPVVRR